MQQPLPPEQQQQLQQQQKTDDARCALGRAALPSPSTGPLPMATWPTHMKTDVHKASWSADFMISHFDNPKYYSKLPAELQASYLQYFSIRAHALSANDHVPDADPNDDLSDFDDDRSDFDCSDSIASCEGRYFWSCDQEPIECTTTAHRAIPLV